MWIVLEYLADGALFEVIHSKKKKINETMITKIFVQIIEALNYLSKKKIVHRDIKPENILCDGKGNFKLCDFGFCAKVGGGLRRKTFCGTDEYFPPEMIEAKDQDEKVDIWCMGIMLYEMLYSKVPFKDMKMLRRKTVSPYAVMGLGTNEELKKIVKLCLKKNAKERPTAGELLEMPYLKKFRADVDLQDENGFDGFVSDVKAKQNDFSRNKKVSREKIFLDNLRDDNFLKLNGFGQKNDEYGFNSSLNNSGSIVSGNITPEQMTRDNNVFGKKQEIKINNSPYLQNNAYFGKKPEINTITPSFTNFSKKIEVSNNLPYFGKKPEDDLKKREFSFSKENKNLNFGKKTNDLKKEKIISYEEYKKLKNESYLNKNSLEKRESNKKTTIKAENYVLNSSLNNSLRNSQKKNYISNSKNSTENNYFSNTKKNYISKTPDITNNKYNNNNNFTNTYYSPINQKTQNTQISYNKPQITTNSGLSQNYNRTTNSKNSYLSQNSQNQQNSQIYQNNQNSQITYNSQIPQNYNRSTNLTSTTYTPTTTNFNRTTNLTRVLPMNTTTTTYNRSTNLQNFENPKKIEIKKSSWDYNRDYKGTTYDLSKSQGFGINSNNGLQEKNSYISNSKKYYQTKNYYKPYPNQELKNRSFTPEVKSKKRISLLNYENLKSSLIDTKVVRQKINNGTNYWVEKNNNSGVYGYTR